MSIDLRDRKHVHVVGIGGAGMSAIATVLVELGHFVTGSDLKTSAALDRLRASGVPVVVGHSAEHVADPSSIGNGAVHSARPDLVARSSAVADRNVEIREARRSGIPVHSRAEVLAAICRLRRTLAVAGTHGKTTTASMLSLVLTEAGCEPSFIVGGDVNEIGSGAMWAAGEWLIVEADESDGTFLRLAPEAAVVTSVEADHLDRYGSVTGLHDAFETFLGGVAGFTLVCTDDPWGAGTPPNIRRRSATGAPAALLCSWRISGRPVPVCVSPCATTTATERRCGCPCRGSTTPSTQWPPWRAPGIWVCP